MIYLAYTSILLFIVEEIHKSISIRAGFMEAGTNEGVLLTVFHSLTCSVSLLIEVRITIPQMTLCTMGRSLLL